MLKKVCAKCGRLYDVDALECDHCHLFLYEYDLPEETGERAYDSKADAYFPRIEGMQLAAGMPGRDLGKTMGMNLDLKRAVFAGTKRAEESAENTEASEAPRRARCRADHLQQNAEKAQTASDGEDHDPAALWTPTVKKSDATADESEVIKQTVSEDAKEESVSSSGGNAGWLEESRREPDDQRNRQPVAPKEKRKVQQYSAEVPLSASSVCFFKGFYLITGWLTIIAGIILGVVLSGGAAMSSLRMYMDRNTARLVASAGWVIPVPVIFSGMMQLAEGHFLGMLLDTNRKLSGAFSSHRNVYKSSVLSLMSGIYVIAGWLVVLGSVLLGAEAGKIGFVLCVLAGVLIGSFLMMQGKRIGLLMDSNKKAAGIMEYVERRDYEDRIGE